MIERAARKNRPQPTVHLEAGGFHATIQDFRVGVLPSVSNADNIRVGSERSAMPDIRIAIRLGR